MSRLAIVDYDKCRPDKCAHECKKSCPVNRTGKACIEIEEKAQISAELCIGCGQCVRVCPFKAIKIVNLPRRIDSELLFNYGSNRFHLYKCLRPKKGQVVGILGQNGIGKSTLIKILSGELLPTFHTPSESEFSLSRSSSATVEEVLRVFRGTELQDYFLQLYRTGLVVSQKPQQVKFDSDVKLGNYLLAKGISELSFNHKRDPLDLANKWHTPLDKLSGGESQRVQILTCLKKEADVYIFDEPTNFLDVKQRIRVSDCIQSLKSGDRYVIAIDHDLSILDYLSDTISIMYGDPSAYGVVTQPTSRLEAINMYFDGYLRNENTRIREKPISLNFSTGLLYEEEPDSSREVCYSSGTIQQGNFNLKIEEGSFYISGGITLVLGENGTGKSTFLKFLKEQLSERFDVMHKGQENSIKKFRKKSGEYLTVRQSFNKFGRKRFHQPMFNSDVIEPLDIGEILDQPVDKLSGGERQRFMIALALSIPAQIYMLDEPSANLDIEQRIQITRVIKRFIIHRELSAFIVEHDMMVVNSFKGERFTQIVNLTEAEKSEQDAGADVVASAGASRTEGEGEARYYTVGKPLPMSTGLNQFLEELNVTFRRDARTGRARINKKDSSKDVEQKRSRRYYQ